MRLSFSVEKGWSRYRVPADGIGGRRHLRRMFPDRVVQAMHDRDYTRHPSNPELTCAINEGRLLLTGRHGCGTRPVVVATMPKSGTYFVAEYLKCLGLVDSGAHADEGGFSDYRGRDRSSARTEFKSLYMRLPLRETLCLLGPGQYLVGHLPLRDETRDLFSGIAVIAVRREVRAALVSFMRWIELSGRADEADHEWLGEPPGPIRTASFLRARGEALVGYFSLARTWLDEPCATQVAYEDLVGDFGEFRKADAAHAIAKAVGAPHSIGEALQCLRAATGTETLTYSGRRTTLDEHWSAECEGVFDALGGDELNGRLGYNTSSPVG